MWLLSTVLGILFAVALIVLMVRVLEFSVGLTSSIVGIIILIILGILLL